MSRKVVLSMMLLVGLIGVLVAGAIIRTVDKTAQVAEAQGSETGRRYGQEAGREERQGYEDSSQGQGRGRRGSDSGAAGQGSGEEYGRTDDGYGGGEYGTPSGSGDLSGSEVEALLMALDDEYKAWSVYEQVIDDFGAVRPFTNIQQAEENHIAALVTLFDHYGLAVPVNGWPGNVPSFDTVAEACEAGVQAEIDNAALYDQLLGMTDNPDIIQVFTSLQQASQTKHLPAFERCAP